MWTASPAASGFPPQALEQEIASLPHISRAKRENEIARPRGAGHSLGCSGDRRYIVRGAVAEGLHAAHELFRCHAIYGLLRCRINIDNPNRIGLVEAPREFIHQSLGARVP